MKNNKVIIICRDKNDQKKEFKANRVYIGAGFLSTAKIIFNSYNTKIHTKTTKAIDSQYFFLPALMRSSAKNILSEKLHTLSQCFIEINNKEISESWSHLQIYTFNDLFLNLLKKRLWFIYPLIKRLLEKILLGRIIFLQGYLHSDLSSKAEIKVNTLKGEVYLSVKKIDNHLTKN